MTKVQFINVFARYNIDLRIPFNIERFEMSKLFVLKGSKFREIVLNQLLIVHRRIQPVNRLRLNAVLLIT